MPAFQLYIPKNSKVSFLGKTFKKKLRRLLSHYTFWKIQKFLCARFSLFYVLKNGKISFFMYMLSASSYILKFKKL